ncbi:putative aldehyde dehydrogenase-like protein C922.07c [Aspergillus lentulus]|nr:putative aldehyde dehydrogenase-like protein C922.07c [Aspergillus lentulus]
MPFSDIEAVISAANSTSAGLSASVWGEDAKATQRIADSLDVGTVFVNGPHVQILAFHSQAIRRVE